MLMVSWTAHESPDTVSAGGKLIVVTQQFFFCFTYIFGSSTSEETF